MLLPGKMFLSDRGICLDAFGPAGWELEHGYRPWVCGRAPVPNRAGRNTRKELEERDETRK